jgi:sulfate adenylyltransferase
MSAGAIPDAATGHGAVVRRAPGPGPDGLPPPHGGQLAPRAVADPAEAAAEVARTAEMSHLTLRGRVLDDLDLLASGAMSPLTGFMGAAEYRSVVEGMRLPGGLLWSLPVTLPVPEALAAACHPGGEVALAGEDGSLAILTVEDRFARDLAWEARMVYGTDDPRHPGVAALLAEPATCLGGPVKVLRRRGGRRAHELDPAETRREFAARGWRTVVAFQSRNPAHRAHEYLQKCALEICDGLLIHPLVGRTKGDDIPADVRLRAYEALIAGYYPPERVVLAAFPAPMRYAGPREAVFHAICRKNYGCTHFIVGRDHAGVGDFYGPFDAQRLLGQLAVELGVVPLAFEHAFYCRRCGAMATRKTCPHGPADHVTLSGTAVRAMLRRGELPPPEFTRPEVARVLAEARPS